jgi:hypothetical protein
MRALAVAARLGFPPWPGWELPGRRAVHRYQAHHGSDGPGTVLVT